MERDMICGIEINGRNYYYTMEDGHISCLMTYREMWDTIRRTNRLLPQITDEHTDEEWDATEDFYDYTEDD